MFSNVIAHHVPFAKTSPQPHENEWKRQISILSSYYCERCSDLADFPSVPGPHFENHWFTFWGLNEIAVTIDTHPTSCEEKQFVFQEAGWESPWTSTGPCVCPGLLGRGGTSHRMCVVLK